MPPCYRICWVGSHGARAGGYPSVGRVLADRFVQDGHQVILTSVKRGRLSKLTGMLATLLRRRRDYEIVIIDVFSTAALWYARLCSRLARRLGKKVVLLLHGGSLPALAREKPDRLRALLGRADRIVAPSAYLAREVCVPLQVEPLVIGNPVDLARFEGRTRDPVRMRLLWVRSFRRHYRPEQAVRVLALLRKDAPGAHLTMVGPEHDGSLAASKALAAERGVSDSIEFPGLLDHDEIASIGSTCEVFLNTSLIDNAPVSMIEAMAMGLCVVSTRVGGVADLLSHEQDGLLVDADAPDQMAAAVRRLAEEEGLAQRLSSGAMARASAFGLDHVSAAWYDCFDHLLQARESPSGAVLAS